MNTETLPSIESLQAENAALEAQLAELQPKPKPASPDEPLISARLAKGLTRPDAVAAVRRMQRKPVRRRRACQAESDNRVLPRNHLTPHRPG